MIVMFDTTDFLSDPVLSKIQAGIGKTDPIPILCMNHHRSGDNAETLCKKGY